MINNNRQQNGRRRGRGGQRQGGGNQGNGSRIDNRARGNAAQLLEKYKSLAADAQRQGDRVNTEYYLQFADHYFRVVSEQRGRFEDQDRQRRESQGQFDQGLDGDDDYDGDEGGEARTEQPREQQPRRYEGERDGNRDNNREGGRDADRDDRPRRDRGPRGGNRPQPRADVPAEGIAASEGDPIENGEQQAAPRPRRGRPRRDEGAPVSTANDAFDPDRLPPSFAPANDGGDDAPNDAPPRRRRLRPAGDATSAG